MCAASVERSTAHSSSRINSKTAFRAVRGKPIFFVINVAHGARSRRSLPFFRQDIISPKGQRVSFAKTITGRLDRFTLRNHRRQFGPVDDDDDDFGARSGHECVFSSGNNENFKPKRTKNGTAGDEARRDVPL